MTRRLTRINERRRSEFAVFLGETIHMSIEDYVTTNEAARILGVTRGAVAHWLRDRVLFAVKMGPRAFLIQRSAVEALKEKRARR